LHYNIQAEEFEFTQIRSGVNRLCFLVTKSFVSKELVSECQCQRCWHAAGRQGPKGALFLGEFCNSRTVGGGPPRPERFPIIFVPCAGRRVRPRGGPAASLFYASSKPWYRSACAAIC